MILMVLTNTWSKAYNLHIIIILIIIIKKATKYDTSVWRNTNNMENGKD